MTCNQLGGACDTEFQAQNFDEMANQAKQHGLQMQSDPAHLEAMNKMGELMKDPQKLHQWMEQKRQEFDALPEN